MGDPGLLLGGVDVSASLPEGRDDRTWIAAEMAPSADWTPFLVTRWITACRDARLSPLVVKGGSDPLPLPLRLTHSPAVSSSPELSGFVHKRIRSLSDYSKLF